MITKPMLASSDSISLDEIDELQYPLYATPKLDGIRCLIGLPETQPRQLTALSRKLISIPNENLQEWAQMSGIPGMDGELFIPQKTFYEIQSVFMSEHTPLPISWCYYVFDWYYSRGRGYLQRLQIAKIALDNFGPSHVRLLIPTLIPSPLSLRQKYERAIRKGYEGLILRNDGPYKQGRSTRREGLMLKMKQFQDAEATIIDFEPEYENLNPSTRDNTGASKRSHHKANLRARARLGKFLVRDALGREFKVGASCTHVQKEEIWRNRASYRHQILTYTYQTHGVKNLPKCPIFKSIRKD